MSKPKAWQDEISEFVFFMRDSAGLSLTELADRMKIEASLLRSCERGTCPKKIFHSFEPVLRMVVKEELLRRRSQAAALRMGKGRRIGLI